MKSHKRTKLFALLAVLTVTPFARASDVPDADVAVASRVSDMGTELLRKKFVAPEHLQACQAMLKAAAKLDPAEQRYPRLLVEACVSQGDTDGAIAALKSYRALAPDDLGAQMLLIQLNLGKMETADAKLAYLNQILGSTVHPDVRSGVAVSAAKLFAERGQQEQSNLMVDQALRLNSVNAEALRLRYQNGMEGMSEFQKVQVLIAMVKANPMQPDVVAELSDRLADFGLVKQSLDWYLAAVRLYQKTGTPIPLDLALNYAAEQFIAERYDGADGLAIRLLQSDPYNVDALYVRLMCARNTPVADDDFRLRNFARKTMLARLKGVRDQVSGVPATQPATAPDAIPVQPTTRKAESFPGESRLPATLPSEAEEELSPAALPDFSAALAKIDLTAKSPEKSALINVISDAAWYSVYFDPKPDVVQSLLETLSKLVPADDTTLVRLQGWNLLAQNKPEEAKVKLSAVADRDPMAALGLIKMEPVTSSDANFRGRRLLSENPSRMLGLFLKESLRDRGIKVAASDKAQTISDQLAKFPMNWLNIIDKPSDFYLVRGTPMSGQFDYREPVLVNVTIQNLSEFDITMGTDGVLHSDLWIDASMPIPNPQNFPGAAYDRITKQLVLRAKQSVNQVIRVDRGALAAAMNANPTAPQQVWVTVVTNPAATQGGVGAGPGGYRVQLSKMVARAGFAIGSDQVVDKLLESLPQASFGKISMMDLLASYIRQARATPSDDRLAKLAPRFSEKLTAMKVDSSASVRAWSRYITADLADSAAKLQLVQEMSRSDEWPTRLLAAVTAEGLDAELRKSVLAELSGDAEPVVKDYASAILKAPSATTQPTTAPTTAPTTESTTESTTQP